MQHIQAYIHLCMHTHFEQTNRDKEQRWLVAVFREETCHEFVFERRESSTDILGDVVPGVKTKLVWERVKVVSV